MSLRVPDHVRFHLDIERHGMRLTCPFTASALAILFGNVAIKSASLLVKPPVGPPSTP